MYYNVRVKRYPDGCIQYFYSERAKQKDYVIEERKQTGDSVARKERENMSRAIQKVYDYAKSNHFDWFVTFTFDGAKVNRYSYDACATVLKAFTNNIRQNGNTWLIVPEQHKDGAYHFHGLIGGDLRVAPAVNPYNGKLLFDDGGRQIYNLLSYQCGYTSAVKTDGSPKLATYIAKYLSKEITVPKGRKRYWASRKLQLPTEEYIEMSQDEFGPIFNDARYNKVIDSPYGMYLLAET